MNVLKPAKKITLLTLVQNHVSQHEIAKKTGIDRKTIRKYQAQLKPPGRSASNSPMATGSGESFGGPFSTQNHGPPGAAPLPKGARSGPPAGAAGVVRKPSCSACDPHHDWIAVEVEKGRNAIF